ncbi:MAG TPA: hypothetical protein VHK66_08545 [Microvirga sp.]|jgi:hypothetical protein|nr:hypothetical protein [Microvirga sp.]
MRTLATTLMMMMLVIAVGSAGPQIGSLAADTFAQHHRWSRKFEPPADPAVTGAVGLQADVEVRTELPACPHRDLRFDNLPVEHWRIERC